jgi:alkanesulfonate monooxygenase SsuD/methylene tetrahydromethanopterin reductase-like flavin-dependent oxidoreductase (luciferase family)
MQSTYMRPRSHRLLYEEARRQAQLVESLGFDSMWMGSHHFAYDGYCPSLLNAASYLLAATTTLKVGAGVLLYALHGPARLADAASAINSFAPGRLAVAVAAGWREIEFRGTGVALGDRARLMDEYTEAIVDGPEAERFAGTELWMGGFGPAPMRRAGRFGASLYLAYAGPEEVATRRGIALAHWREGAPPPKVAVIKDVWIDPSAERREWIRLRQREMWRFYAKFGDGAGAESDDIEDRLDANMAWGTIGDAEALLAALVPIVEAGVDELVLRVRFDGIEGAIVDECLAQLAAEVVPIVRAAA